MNIYELKYNLNDNTVKTTVYKITDIDEIWYYIKNSNDYTTIKRDNIITSKISIKETLLKSNFLNGTLYFIDDDLCDRYIDYIKYNYSHLASLIRLINCRYNLNKQKKYLDECITEIMLELDNEDDFFEIPEIE